MKFKTGDKVIVVAGKDKGNNGRISKVLKDENKVIVEGINLVKKHLKPNANNQTGGIVSKEAPLDASNVMFYDEKSKKRSRKRLEENTTKEKKAPKKAKKD